jgi:hypothetical protein
MEVFAEKMLQACHTLLGVVAELKRNALLNDVAGRNAEVHVVVCVYSPCSEEHAIQAYMHWTAQSARA